MAQKGATWREPVQKAGTQEPWLSILARNSESDTSRRHEMQKDYSELSRNGEWTMHLPKALKSTKCHINLHLVRSCLGSRNSSICKVKALNPFPLREGYGGDKKDCIYERQGWPSPGIITGLTVRSSWDPKDIHFNPFHCEYWGQRGVVVTVDQADVEPLGREVYVKVSQSSISGATPYARKRAYYS